MRFLPAGIFAALSKFCGVGVGPRDGAEATESVELQGGTARFVGGVEEGRGAKEGEGTERLVLGGAGANDGGE